MGCGGLLAEPWSLKNKAMAREFLTPRTNQWDGTIRRNQDRWTADMWANVYSFRKEERKLAARTDRYINGKF